MISKGFGLILFSSSFSAFKHISTKFRSTLFKIEATIPRQRLFFQISRKYTTKIEHKNQMGQQNVFYFEESKLLKTVEDANDSNYMKLRETLPVVLLLGWTGGKDAHLKKYSDFQNRMFIHIQVYFLR